MSNTSTYVIGIIILCLLVAGGSSLMGIMVQHDKTMLDGKSGMDYANFNKTFNKQQDIVKNVNDMKDQLTKAPAEFGVYGVLNSLISTAWNLLQTIFTSFDFMTSMFTSLDEYYGIPTWVGTLVVSIIFTVIIFAILGAIFQREV